MSKTIRITDEAADAIEQIKIMEEIGETCQAVNFALGLPFKRGNVRRSRPNMFDWHSMPPRTWMFFLYGKTAERLRRSAQGCKKSNSHMDRSLDVQSYIGGYLVTRLPATIAPLPQMRKDRALSNVNLVELCERGFKELNLYNLEDHPDRGSYKEVGEDVSGNDVTGENGVD